MVRLGLWAAPSPIFAKITGPLKQEEKVDMEVQDGEGTNTSSSDQSSSSLTGSAFEPAGDIADEESEIITSGSGLQNSMQDEDWEDLADTKMTPNSSIHILAKSAEVTANLQNGGNDWIDLKERSDEDQADAVTKDGKSVAQADKVQHEVAALKMAQGLLKGELDATKANAATLEAQLQMEAADKEQLSTKLADSESIKNELEAKIAALMKDKAALEARVFQAAVAPPAKTFKQIDTLPKYCCKTCGMDIASAKAVMWSDCKMGRSNESGMLFGATVNAERTGKVTVTHLATGDYEVQDVRCQKCSTSLGWTYLKAFTEKNKFKEGSTILYKRLLAPMSK